MSNLDGYLKEVVEDLSAQLPLVTQKRMFGSDAFFANNSIYALIWDGRIVLKVPREESFSALVKMPGATPWAPMPDKERAMKHWVVVSEELHDDTEGLKRWVEEAHRAAMSAPAKKTKPAKKKRPRRG